MLKAFVELSLAALRDRRGLESLEYTVFAVALLVIIATAVVELSADITAAYADVATYIRAQAGAL